MKTLIPLFSFRNTDYWAALGALIISTLFSPIGWLLKTVLSPYLDWTDLTTSKLAPTAFLQTLFAMFTQLQDLGPAVLLGKLLPLLILCLSASIFYLWICQKALQSLLKSRQPVS
jgi:hypothetical protein